MKPRKFEIIECPKCGRQYLPAELFVPNAFFGKPRDIIRDVYGQILEYEGTSVDLADSYTCDNCNTTFQVRAKMQFIVENTKVDNFDKEYSTPLYKNVLFLNES